MGKCVRRLAVLLMAIMLMAPACVFAANSPVAAPAAPTQTVTVKSGKESYKKSTAKVISLKKNKKVAKSFKIKVVKGAKVVSNSKKVAVKKVNATTYKVTVKKNAKASAKLTVSAKGYKTVTIKVTQK